MTKRNGTVDGLGSQGGGLVYIQTEFSSDDLSFRQMSIMYTSMTLYFFAVKHLDSFAMSG